MRTILALIIGFARCASLQCQTPAYLHYDVSDGLPGNVVYCGTQDHRGLLWFGTDKGLACFDGSRFRIYGTKDGLPDPEVLNLKEDSKGRLWISCFRKKPCYMLNGKIISAATDSMLKKMDFRSGICNFYEDGQKNIWITASNNNVYQINEHNLARFDFSNYPMKVRRWDANFLWLGMPGITLTKELGEERTEFAISKKNKSTNGFPALLGVEAIGNKIVYAFIDKIISFKLSENQLLETGRLLVPGGPVYADQQNRFWVCSANTGTICFENDKGDLSNPVVYFKNRKIINMFEDRQQTLWFCTAGEGVIALPKNAPINFTKQDKLLSNNITSLFKLPSGKILLGGDEGFIQVCHNGAIEHLLLPASKIMDRSRQVLQTPDGALWAAFDKNLYRIKSNKRQVLSDWGAMKAIHCDKEYLWIGTHSELLRLRLNEDVLKPARIQLRRTTALGEDGNGNIWAGSIDGFYSQADSFQYNWGETFNALKSRIVAIRKGENNNLWVATPDSGLLKVSVHLGKVNSVEVVNNQLSHPIQNIQSLFTEPNGMLWMATNTGVYGLDRNLSVTHYDKHDGLADNDVNAVLANNDTLWMATVSGLTILKRSAQTDHGDFPTYLAHLRYKNKQQTITYHLLDSLPGHKNIALPPEASLIEFDFAGLDYQSRGNLRYEYKVVQKMPPLPQLTFSALIGLVKVFVNDKPATTLVEGDKLNLGIDFPHGTYQITLTAIKRNGTRSLYPDAWILTFKPYWYQTIWFYLLIWGIVGYIAWRMLQTWAAYRRLHNEVSELQLQAIKSQINPHFIGNSINAIQQFFYPPDPTKASEYVSIFTRLLRSTMSFSEKAFITLEEELAYDTDYLKMIQLRFDDRFEFSIQGGEAFPPETLFPSMLLQPILENATVHGLAPAGKSILKIKFEKIGAKLVCSISDNGIGFVESMQLKQQNQSKRESKGLALIKDKILTVNKLYKTDFQMAIEDLSSLNSLEHGTRVSISYTPAHINPKYKSV